MGYKTYHEQIAEHIKHLKSQGLDIVEFKIDTLKWVRCQQVGEPKGRGNYAYITNTKPLANGLIGMITSYRGPNGSGNYKSYGVLSDQEVSAINILHTKAVFERTHINPFQERAARKAFGFWQRSHTIGTSDYLDSKGVGYHGIRFRTSKEYGNVGIVPMFDKQGRLWNRQLLNQDGTKLMVKEGRIEGLFHMLRRPLNGQLIGISEGYVTGATCMELSGIPTICAFSSENLAAATQAIISLFPASPIIIFADNDRHLEAKGGLNKGVSKAQEAQKLAPDRVSLAIPDFVEYAPSKQASDWNDLMWLAGRSVVETQIRSTAFSPKIDLAATSS